MGLCCAYLAVSLPRIWPLLKPRPIGPAAPLYSTDCYLTTLIGRTDASARILQTLAPLPQDKTVILFLPDTGVKSRLVVLTLIYLSWPREVRWLPVKDSDVERQLMPLAPSSLAALIFWDVKPPDWLPAGIPLSPDQVIVPIVSVKPPKG